MSQFDYDLFVIGGGSGGVRAARLAAQLGVRTAIAEEYRFGGTCVVRGCIPKKLLVYAGELGHAIDDAAAYGWRVEGKSFDWKTLIANKDREIARLSGLYRQNLEKAGAEIIESRAEIVDPHTIRIVETGREVTAERILVATGGRPFVPDIPGREFGITSDQAFHLEELPRRAVIVGGGYIAIEFACIFNALGSEVEVVYRGEEILRGFDHDLRQMLSDQMQANGIAITCGEEPAAVEKEGKELVLLTKQGSRFGGDVVMFATGRVPNTVGLGLQKLGVECGWNGNLVVDETYRTSVPSIFAVGDVTDRVNLTPVAIRDAITFIEANYKDNPKPLDLSFIPTAVFSQPEFATVGYTEEHAREMFRQVDIYKTTFRPLKHTLTGRAERMMMKLVVDGETDRVIGCHILGPAAAEMIQIAAIPIRLGVKKSDFDATIALHPTAAEELVTMREKAPPSSDTPPSEYSGYPLRPGHRS